MRFSSYAFFVKKENERQMSQKLTQYFAIQFKILNISWRNWYVYSSCKMTLSNVRERLSNAPKH